MRTTPPSIKNRTLQTFLPLLLLLAFLLCPGRAMAEPFVTAYYNDPDVFSLVANNLNWAKEIEISFNYRSDNQAQPSVNCNSQALATVIINTGTVVIKLVSKKHPFGGNVNLAYARFQGTITYLTVRVLYVDGTTGFPRVSVINPTWEQQAVQVDKASQAAQAAQAEKDRAEQAEKDRAAQGEKDKAAQIVKAGSSSETAPSAVAESAASTVDGAALSPEQATPGVMPTPKVGIPIQRGTPGIRDVIPGPAQTADGANVAYPRDDELSTTVRFSRREGLSDRFSMLAGERTPTALERLLHTESSDNVQEPPLLLSDGSSLRLTIRPAGGGLRSPQFFISGANCTGLKAGEQGSWILEITPNKGVTAATVIVLSGQEAIEYPLSVAPPLSMFDAASAGPDLAAFVKAANGLLRSGDKQGK